MSTETVWMSPAGELIVLKERAPGYYLWFYKKDQAFDVYSWFHKEGQSHYPRGYNGGTIAHLQFLKFLGCEMLGEL